MSVNVELHGQLWHICQGGNEVFSKDYREVEEWLDHAEIHSKYPDSPAGTEPLSTHAGRLPYMIPQWNVPRTSAKL